jgi:hypothetical protein
MDQQTIDPVNQQTIDQFITSQPTYQQDWLHSLPKSRLRLLMIERKPHFWAELINEYNSERRGGENCCWDNPIDSYRLEQIIFDNYTGTTQSYQQAKSDQYISTMPVGSDASRVHYRGPARS